jgi:hypothetical protein
MPNLTKQQQQLTAYRNQGQTGGHGVGRVQTLLQASSKGALQHPAVKLACRSLQTCWRSLQSSRQQK